MLSAHWFGKWHETVIMSNLYGSQYTENYERELQILIYLKYTYMHFILSFLPYFEVVDKEFMRKELFCLFNASVMRFVTTSDIFI